MRNFSILLRENVGTHTKNPEYYGGDGKIWR